MAKLSHLFDFFDRVNISYLFQHCLGRCNGEMLAFVSTFRFHLLGRCACFGGTPALAACLLGRCAGLGALGGALAMLVRPLGWWASKVVRLPGGCVYAGVCPIGWCACMGDASRWLARRLGGPLPGWCVLLVSCACMGVGRMCEVRPLGLRAACWGGALACVVCVWLVRPFGWCARLGCEWFEGCAV